MMKMTDDDVKKAFKQARTNLKRAKTALEKVWFSKKGLNDGEYKVAQDVETLALDALEPIERALGELSVY